MELTARHEDVDHCKIRIDVEIPFKELRSEYEIVKQEFSKRTHLPGFRKGKVPPAMVERQFQASIRWRVIENLLPRAFEQTVREKNLKTFGQPVAEKISEYEENKPLSIQFEVDKMPSVTLGDTSGFTWKEIEYTISKKDVEREIKNRLSLKAELIESNEIAVQGMFIRLRAMPKDKYLQFLGVENGTVKLDPSEEIPLDLYRDLIGMKKGEKKVVRKTYPSDHRHHQLAGRSLDIDLEVIDLKEIKIPLMTDELAKEMGYASVETFRAGCRESLQEHARKYAETQKKNAVLKWLWERSSFELSPKFIDATADRYLNNLKTRLKKGSLYASFLASRNMREEDLLEDYKKQIERDVRNELILREIIEKEKIEVSEEEILSQIREQAEKNKEDIKKLRKEMIKSGVYTRLRDDIHHQKAIDFVIRQGK